MSCGCELVPHGFGRGTGTGGGEPSTEWFYITDESDPDFNDGFSNWAETDTLLMAYRKQGDIVYLAGQIEVDGASPGEPAFTLPVGFRPATTAVYLFFVGSDPMLPTRGLIETNGDVNVTIGESPIIVTFLEATSWFNLNPSNLSA